MGALTRGWPRGAARFMGGGRLRVVAVGASKVDGLLGANGLCEHLSTGAMRVVCGEVMRGR